MVETGQIEPLRKVEVKSKAGGRLLRLFVEEGAIVRQGQILATIDPQEVNSQVAALRAQLAAAQARLASARTNVGFQQATTTTGIDQYTQNLAAAKARLESAEADASVQPTLTQQSIDIAQSNLEAARAQLKAQQDNLNLLMQSTHPNNVVAAQAAYDQARANYENALRSVDRQKKLNAKGFVSQQVVDSAQVEADVAASRVTEAKTRLERMPQTQNALEDANARSQVAAAQGQVQQMEAALAQARSNILPATKRHDLDSARAAYAQAKAQLEQARAGRAQDTMRGSDAQASAAEVQQIQQQLNERLVSQKDTTLYAPMSGVVTRRYAEVGDLIASAIASFSSGTPVYQVADTATMLVKLNVNEVDISKVKVGLPAEVTIDASKGAKYAGHVRKVSPVRACRHVHGQHAATDADRDPLPRRDTGRPHKPKHASASRHERPLRHHRGTTKQSFAPACQLRTGNGQQRNRAGGHNGAEGRQAGGNNHAPRRRCRSARRRLC